MEKENETENEEEGGTFGIVGSFKRFSRRLMLSPGAAKQDATDNAPAAAAADADDDGIVTADKIAARCDAPKSILSNGPSPLVSPQGMAAAAEEETDTLAALRTLSGDGSSPRSDSWWFAPGATTSRFETPGYDHQSTQHRLSAPHGQHPPRLRRRRSNAEHHPRAAANKTTAVTPSSLTLSTSSSKRASSGFPSASSPNP
jgi:hypothetical protein